MTTKWYVAFYREGRDGGTRARTDSNYTSKKDYAQDLRANGYRVVVILSAQQVRTLTRKKSWEVKQKTLRRLDDGIVRYCKEELEHV